MDLNFLEIFILAAIQGISEFIPVSSSAHLFFISEMHNFKSQNLLTDIGLHLGSLLAIIAYFRNEFIDIFNNKNLLFLLLFGSLPLVIFGTIIYQTGLIYYFRNIQLIAWTTLVFAIILYFVQCMGQGAAGWGSGWGGNGSARLLGAGLSPHAERVRTCRETRVCVCVQVFEDHRAVALASGPGRHLPLGG